ncbi:MAG TPA: PAS domain S-box protein [Bdellovibrionales bacterium]|nr:PAS domain S-box protein [Bdellovibrionales bacterium]
MNSQSRRRTENKIPVAGIGYSAGGLDAARALLSKLPTDAGMAFVVIQHLKPDEASQLSAILAKSTRLPVRTITDRMPLEPNTVFVIPPGTDVALSGDTLHINPRGESTVHALGIDFFFSSLAQNRGSQAVGVVLSGSGGDGTLGAKAIKGEGGIVIVQDPQTAAFDSMPKSAIASGVADLILAPADIGTELGRIARHPYTITALKGSSHAPTPENEVAHKPTIFKKILGILFDQTKVDFSQYKLTTIHRRIERQMMLRKIETAQKYAEYLSKHPEEVRALYEDIFIHVTDFFRDPEAYEALRKKVFPALAQKRTKDSPIRVWVPGCATGEEVYSLAISFIEYFEENGLELALTIFAGDISEPAIQRARRGAYADYQMRNVSPERLSKFFEPVKGGYKIKKEIRDICIFSRHDLTSNPPIPKVDLVSCRNVLIYFSAELQKRVLPIFHYALNDSGFLWLGRAESPDAYPKLFVPADKTSKIFVKAKTDGPVHTRPSTLQRDPAGLMPLSRLDPQPAAADPVRNVDQVLLHRYSPPSVVINSNFEILQFRGRTVPYLEPSPGAAGYNLLKMANPDLLAPIRLCVQAAKKQETNARKEGVAFEFEGKRRRVNIDVSPLNGVDDPKNRQYLVIFEDPQALRPLKQRAGAAMTVKAPRKADGHDRSRQVETLSQYVAQLQSELETSAAYQQSLVEEYETAQEELTSTNEELRSTNEELQSTNEELHSTNEELNTAKEELQAANEELLSMNEELQKRNADLEATLKKLEFSERRFRLMIAGVRDYAIFMLDPSGNIATWNDGAERLKGYKADEIIGTHFSKFYTPEDIARNHPAQELQLAAKNGKYEEEGWRLRRNGTRFWASVLITAMRDSTGTLIGYSKVTRDLTERKEAQDRLRVSEERFRLMVTEVKDYAILMLDPDGKVTTWNEGARRLKGYDESEIIGRHFSVFYPPEDVKNGKPEFKLEQARKIGKVEDEGWRVRKDGSRFWANVVITCITDAHGQIIGYAKVTRDLTDRMRSEQAKIERARQAAQLEQVESLADSISHIVWVAGPDNAIEFYNQRWYDYTGLTIEQSRDMKVWREVIHPDDYPRIRESWYATTDNKSVYETQWRMRRKDGTYRWHLVRTVPSVNSEGKVTSWFGTSTDIDDQVRATEHDKILADTASVFTESLDVQKTLQSLANVIVKHLADWVSIDLIDTGKTPRRAAAAHPDPERLKLAEELFRDYPTDWSANTGAPNVVRTGKPELYTEVPEHLLRASAKDARHWELIRDLGIRSAMVVPLVARGRTLGVITFIASESGRRYSGEDLRLAEELGRRAGVAVDNAILYTQLEQAIKTRDEFLSIASHELKTPLTALKLQAQITTHGLAKGLASFTTPQRLNEFAGQINAQVGRLNQLVDDMLDVSRIQSGKLAPKPETVELGELSKNICEQLIPLAKSSGSALELKAANVTGYWDRYRIEQVMVNLITNAIKYGAGKPIEVAIYDGGGSAKIEVRDQGIGISPENHTRIFERFERAVSYQGISGLGLGLYISKNIVDLHKGTIRVDSELGKGSRFTVELPLDPFAAQSNAQERRS